MIQKNRSRALRVTGAAGRNLASWSDREDNPAPKENRSPSSVDRVFWLIFFVDNIIFSTHFATIHCYLIFLLFFAFRRHASCKPYFFPARFHLFFLLCFKRHQTYRVRLSLRVNASKCFGYILFFHFHECFVVQLSVAASVVLDSSIGLILAFSCLSFLFVMSS